jgi:hypothetical protein
LISVILIFKKELFTSYIDAKSNEYLMILHIVNAITY